MEAHLKNGGLIVRAFENFSKLGRGLMTMGACLSRMEQLKKRWDEFEKRHEALTASEEVDMKDDYFVKDQYSVVYEAFLNNLGLFQDHLLQVKKETLQIGTQPKIDESIAEMDVNRAKLPAIVIGDFSGDIQDWVRFRDTFKQMVIERPNLPAIFKMNYLRTYVKGEAAELLQEVPSGGEHFATAWKVLLSHYDNKRLLLNKLMTKLMSLPAMANDSAVELMRVLNGVRNLLQALKALGSPVQHWDHFTVFLTRSKITQQCRVKWEDSVNQLRDPTVPDTFEDLCKFLEAERNALSLLESTKDFTKKNSSSTREAKATTSKGRRSSNFVQSSSDKSACPVCSEAHVVEQCPQFRRQSVVERKRTLGHKRLCYRCFGTHMCKDCKSIATCFTCNGKHHTLLHTPLKKDAKKTAERPRDDSSEVDETSPATQNVLAAVSSNVDEEVLETLLATAQVRVSATGDEFTMVRALVDQCAQSSFVTENLCQRLRLRKRKVNVPISGIGQGPAKTRAEVEILIRPHFESQFKLSFKAYVLPAITNYQPFCKQSREWQHIEGLQLADPNFTRPGRIDLLLSTQIHARIIQAGLRKGDEKAPIAMQTQLGWILSGNAEKSARRETFVCLQTDDRMSEQLKSFWELEEPPHVIPWSSEDQLCEKHYQANTIRLSDGRYQVRLPMKPDAPSDWVNSYQIARSCLLSLERKLYKNPSLYAEYSAAIQQMIKSDQMRKVSITPQDYRSHYFLPHHAVVKDSSTTTRVRPVFNASARNAAGHSLNEHLMTGPNLLPQLILVLAHWRCYPVAFVADVSKMYLQVRIHPDDWKYQSILWRDDPKKEIDNYVLTTVTFGSGPSAFLANRTLRQLASDEGEKYPLAVPIVHKEMYMDDVLSGAYDVELARQKRDQLSGLFAAGGFSLAKWMTNDSNLLNTFSPESLAKEATLKVGLGFSVLGLVWEPRKDVFRFNVALEPLSNPITKRKVLSCIAGMFDPSGWIAPILITLKIFMQSLWLLTKEWDLPLPSVEVEKWRALEEDLKGLPSLVIPRWNGVMSEALIELHGFADASKFAYAAVLYVRVIYRGRVRVNLLASKTKVAPLKTQSIPRLELCAAHLLAKLVASFAATEDFVRAKIHLWSDSKTTLHWIHGIPARWPVFVANRCADIVNQVPQANWHYINTKQNPADLASRGCEVAALQNDRLWWFGPEILVSTIQPWVNEDFPATQETSAEIDMFERVVLLQEDSSSQDCEPLLRFSSYSRMQRVMVYCLRFVTRLADKSNVSLTLRFKAAMESQISVDELNQATLQACRMTQATLLAEEIRSVSSSLPLSKKHFLRNLCPVFVDGLLRVGGRLGNANISDDCKHQVILPAKCRLVELLIDHLHKRTLHGGTRLVVTHLRQSFWIPRVTRVVSTHLLKCIVCLRYRAATTSQRMADLPAVRVKPSRLFESSGVDYAGPFRLKASNHRVESEENVQGDAVSKTAPSVSSEVETTVTMSTPQLHTSERAVLSSAGPSTTSTSDELEFTASISSSAAVGSLETDVESIDTDELKKSKLNQGETLMPWRLRPISHYMTYIPTPKAKLKEWRDNLRERDTLIRHKRCSDTTVIDIFEDGLQISDEEYAKWLGQ
ncbi:unnamed protein product [Trichogramma brassicae]|uniref:Integrase zinc-binding domain-containing protein n=1 Tax=Trichogramma brassicae TaxID=86971 RepID=A0A6H5IR68_9HYME|nr:unnamed protein product [Trichogramma brassicae]